VIEDEGEKIGQMGARINFQCNGKEKEDVREWERGKRKMAGWKDS
jgi:hypothetical protein